MPTPILLILTAAGFGASPLLIAMAVEMFPPWTLAALRSALGLPLLVLAAGMLGPQKSLDRHDLWTALVGGVLVVSIPFVSMAAGMQYIPSGMGGMLYATMPLFTLALAAYFLADEPATLEQEIRIGIGLFGVVLISVPAIVSGGFAEAGLGTVLTLISPLSYAAGNVWFRRRRKVAPLMLAATMFAVGTVTVWPLALLIDGPVPVVPSAEVLLTLLALVVLATVAPNLLNYALVLRAGANRAALAMFLMPGFAVVFGMVFLGERLPPLAFVGLALVIAASTARLPRRLGRGAVAGGTVAGGAVASGAVAGGAGATPARQRLAPGVAPAVGAPAVATPLVAVPVAAAPAVSAAPAVDAAPAVSATPVAAEPEPGDARLPAGLSSSPAPERAATAPESGPEAEESDEAEEADEPRLTPAERAARRARRQARRRARQARAEAG